MHVGIIMDGNGRWATSRGLPRLEGHRRGAVRVKEAVRACPGLGIGTLTLYAFSTENWKRASQEVDGLMHLFRRYLKTQLAELHRENVRVRFPGNPSALPPDIRDLMTVLSGLTEANTGLNLNIAINYGGRDELARAVRKIAEGAVRGTVDVEAISEQLIGLSLDTNGQSDPDLIIRTAGEYRLSNFLTWQGAFAELAFVGECWPDFTPKILAAVIGEFRDRAQPYAPAEPIAAKG